MTTPANETYTDYLSRIADDGAGGVADEATLQANIYSAFGDLGAVETDVGNIPGTATIRLNGTFTDAFSAREYLERGGLIGSDGSGNVIPIGFVYFLSRFDDVLQEYVYDVYIDEDS